MLNLKLPEEEFTYLIEIVGMHHAVQYMKNDSKNLSKCEDLIRKIHQQLKVANRMDIFEKVFNPVEQETKG